ncbi:MAG: 3-oxoacyl-ACP synthase [Deltaproteobacteria bacterium]|nr:3-oxoacyl-ACP synthase [Deltaproteobacteria bacterium]
MTDACVIAAGAVSALGCGVRAYDVTTLGEPPRTAIGDDPVWAAAGLAKPRSARAPATLGVDPSDDRATDLLVAALGQVLAQLDEVLPSWRLRRLGVSVGTSSGGMVNAERLFHLRASDQQPDRATARRATYFAPLVDAFGRFAIDLADVTADEGRDGPRGQAGPQPRVTPVKGCQVLAACASSTIAIGLGHRWLERGACDLVLAGGYDGLSLFVAAGFEAIRATSTTGPKPFRLGRDGMVLGEGAGLVALVREEEGVAPLFRVSGFGASADAVHITAPDPAGGGLTRAGRAALRDGACPPERVGLVSAHGTATPYNDPAEAKAIAAICGATGGPVVHPFKAQIGHTLGAAGVLETLAAAQALDAQVAPGAYGSEPIDPEAQVTLLDQAERRPLGAALKLSAAFGGVAAALVIQQEPSERQRNPARPVAVLGHGQVAGVDRAVLAEATGVPRDRLARIDDLSQLCLGALATLVGQVGRDALAGAGVVAGHGLATLDINERFHARLLAKGARWVDPRLFPATSPNAGPGHCGIVYGLTGPSFAVSAGLGGSLEALVAAGELVAAGDVDRMVVVAADDGGPAASQWVDLVAPGRPFGRGAVAVLLAAADPGAEGEPDHRLVDLDMAIVHDAGPIGHLALQAWLEDTP